MKKYFLYLIISVFLGSCARVGTPGGGDKDTIPPRFLKANMDTSRVNVSRRLGELRLYFDEYIRLRDVSKNLVISPPIKKIKKILPSNLANKYILIQWDEDLQENTTYSFNFGNAIVDNNEGNVLPYFNFAFSTGDKIDNMYIKGSVKDAMLPPNKNSKNGIVVGLYPNGADLKQKPHYITKADEKGGFELNYLSEGKYTLIAFQDDNQNSIYEAGKEKVGFLKDTVNLEQSVEDLSLKIYPSRKKIKYIESRAMAGGMLMRFEGNSKKIEVLPIGDELKNYKVSHRAYSDSVKIWIGKEGNQLKAESATQIQLSYNADGEKDSIHAFFKPNEKEELLITNSKGRLLPPNKEFVVSANMELQNILSEQWELKSDSIAQKFEAKISEKNPEEIHISSDFKAGKTYVLSIPKESVSSFYHKNEKEYIFTFEADKPENYGSVVLKLKNAPKSHFWVHLMNAEGRTQYSLYTNQSEIRFTEVLPATYYARILVDSNDNQHWDNADFEERQLSEPAFVFPKELAVKKLWEIVEDWELE
ncbi:MAG: Ig-like domain-containing protein [Flavobacteriaceae bacterium]|nr:Ig-like domain-containing protein [Flavobacteriaceae bacterium]